MKPYNLIKIGDVYKNPITEGEWFVMDKNDEDKMVKIALLGSNNSIWKKNTDRIFNFPLVLEGV